MKFRYVSFADSEVSGSSVFLKYLHLVPRTFTVIGRWRAATCPSPKVVGCWLLTIGCWLLIVGRWSLVVGCWLLVVGLWSNIAAQS